MRVDIISSSGIIEYRAVEIEEGDTPITFKKRFYPKNTYCELFAKYFYDDTFVHLN